jgi:hypothetical protein
MAYRADPEISKIFGRQAPEHIAVNVVLAKRRLVLFEPEFPQPACDVHVRPRPSGRLPGPGIVARCSGTIRLTNDQNDMRV